MPIAELNSSECLNSTRHFSAYCCGALDNVCCHTKNWEGGTKRENQGEVSSLYRSKEQEKGAEKKKHVYSSFCTRNCDQAGREQTAASMSIHTNAKHTHLNNAQIL